MSSKKRPLRELSQAPQTPRYTPSTPHAIRALQQRSGAGQRTARTNKTRGDEVRPDSARGILRRLAKITAPVTKRRVSTPLGKENLESTSTREKAVDQVEDDEIPERPDLTLPIVEENDWEDEADSDLGEVPTPSALLGGDYDPTITFQTIPLASEARQSMGEMPGRRASRLSNISREMEDVDDDDRDTEIGRRAVSEGPLDRYPRSSFGSIRMSDFGLNYQRQISDDVERKENRFSTYDDYDIGVGLGEDHEPELENETEDFRRHRRWPSAPNELEFDEQDVNDDDNTFRLEIPAEAESPGSHSTNTTNAGNIGQDPGEDEEQDENTLSAVSNFPQQKKRPLIPMEATTTRKPRRKNIKLTRHGVAIPALPSSVIKRIAIDSMTGRGKRKPTIDRASLKALEQATEWFFEQVGEDLEAYSNHAGRTKRIDPSDVLTLMRRQRVLKGNGKLGHFAMEHLPPEALLELDLPDTL